jgi:hypothetical protein
MPQGVIAQNFVVPRPRRHSEATVEEGAVDAIAVPPVTLPQARDRTAAERLWRVSEELTGVTFPADTTPR